MTEQEMSTREQLLNLLKMKGPSSVGELAGQLQITEMAVRRHINTLERDGLIESKRVRQAMGRPTQMYYLSQAADDLFPKGYHKLVLDLLEELDTEDNELVTKLFQQRMRKLERTHEQRMDTKSFHEKVEELAFIQKESGYMAELEQISADSYLLHEYNCPISKVAQRYEQACRCELELFKTLLGTEQVERTECLAKGGGKCTYSIKQST
ncbi:helix-turn-helix transcriptional regulator [Marinicrinis lubricantis]|uniref:Helix-turn-helix transcriptional regulator n=1 Tax=Marinicrinis lubricantis TaxID=2086470 RepID=A0ABW1ITD3_9BACL